MKRAEEEGCAAAVALANDASAAREAAVAQALVHRARGDRCGCRRPFGARDDGCGSLRQQHECECSQCLHDCAKTTPAAQELSRATIVN